MAKSVQLLSCSLLRSDRTDRRHRVQISRVRREHVRTECATGMRQAHRGEESVQCVIRTPTITGIGHVLISDAPQAPSNVEIGHQTEDSVTLRWNKPKSDGGSKITAYQVEVRKPDSDTWEVANDFPIKGTEFTANNLQAGKPYEFRVKAKNAAGWGEYSALDRPVTLKPDNGK